MARHPPHQTPGPDSENMPADEPFDYATPVWAGILPLETRFTQLEADDELPDGVEPSASVRALQRRRL